MSQCHFVHNNDSVNSTLHTDVTVGTIIPGVMSVSTSVVIHSSVIVRYHLQFILNCAVLRAINIQAYLLLL